MLDEIGFGSIMIHLNRANGFVSIAAIVAFQSISRKDASDRPKE